MNKTLIDLAALFLGVILAFIIQDALPPMTDFHSAHVLLVPMVFCFSAMVFPFAAMLVAAFYTGFLSDLMYLHVVGGKVEIPLGSSIIYFVILTENWFFFRNSSGANAALLDIDHGTFVFIF